MIKWLVRLGSAVGLLLIVFLAVLLLLGGGAKVSRAEAHIEIERPAGLVFPWLTEGPRLLRWISGMESFSPNSDEPQVGRRAQVVLSRDGRRYEVASELLAVQPPTLLKVRIDHSEFTDEVEYVLEEHYGRTLLTQRSATQYKDLLIRLMTPLFARDVERTMNENLALLKGLVEHEPSQVPPHPMPGQKSFHGCCTEPSPAAATP